MKKTLIAMFLMLVFSLGVTAQTEKATVAEEELDLGKIYFPKPFIHAGNDYDKGVYQVKLTHKEGIPYFLISRKDELLFEERGVVKMAKEGKRYRVKRYWVKKELLKDYEYFRIKVTKPDRLVMAYFVVKQ